MSNDAVLLGFDFGLRRIGVAVGNSVTRTARPLTVFDTRRVERWEAIGRVIEQWRPARIVVGIARHPDGAAHEMTARCERFARQVEGRWRVPVARVDERYSSAVAAMKDSEGGGADDAAAALILQQWFDENTAESTHDRTRR